MPKSGLEGFHYGVPAKSIAKEPPQGLFIGGPVLGKRTCKYHGIGNAQEIAMVDHPGDGLFARMDARELTKEMERARYAVYYPNGMPPQDAEEDD